jgi:GNAT superfamily N-acetyltransferase
VDAGRRAVLAFGAYFGDPDLFAEPRYLHFESLYTRRDARRRGVAAALIEAVSAIGLPTFAEFRPKWLPDAFERWRVTEEKEDEALLWTQEGAGGSLGVALSLALDGEVLEAPRFEPASFRITLGATAGGERSIAREAEYRAARRSSASSCARIEAASRSRESRSRCWQHRRRGRAPRPATA